MTENRKAQILETQSICKTIQLNKEKHEINKNFEVFVSLLLKISMKLKYYLTDHASVSRLPEANPF